MKDEIEPERKDEQSKQDLNEELQLELRTQRRTFEVRSQNSFFNEYGRYGHENHARENCYYLQQSGSWTAGLSSKLSGYGY
jgi:hypothetical protein